MEGEGRGERGRWRGKERVREGRGRGRGGEGRGGREVGGEGGSAPLYTYTRCDQSVFTFTVTRKQFTNEECMTRMFERKKLISICINLANMKCQSSSPHISSKIYNDTPSAKGENALFHDHTMILAPWVCLEWLSHMHVVPKCAILRSGRPRIGGSAPHSVLPSWEFNSFTGNRAILRRRY